MSLLRTAPWFVRFARAALLTMVATACSDAAPTSALATDAGRVENHDEPDARPGAAFVVRTIDFAPFREVRVWAPASPRAAVTETLVLLHGNQGDPADPTWMVGLRFHPRFRHALLIVPAIAGDESWDARTIAPAVARLVTELSRTYSIDPQATYVLGYSAGGSRVLSVAAHMHGDIAGVVCVAGDVARPIRLANLTVEWLRPKRLLLTCMTEDDGPNTSCQLRARNVRLLESRGVRGISLATWHGTHALDLRDLGDALAGWLPPPE
jgi:poly(3-hydroxybutyrate) depolymerase